MRVRKQSFPLDSTDRKIRRDFMYAMFFVFVAFVNDKEDGYN